MPRPDAPAADRAKAKAKADELLAALRKAPDSFAEAAKKNSQDPGSAPNGGDLDFFARGAMVKPFEEAAFALKKGEISNVVESEFGYHIIKLTDIKAPKQRSFDEMKAEIEADVKKQQAQKKFAESADAFTNGVFEQSDSLKPVADRLKLTIRTATNLTRQPAPGVTGVLANPKFLNAIFSPDSVEKKRNTEAVETASSQLVSGRITQYTPARTLPLAEVKERVRERLTAQARGRTRPQGRRRQTGCLEGHARRRPACRPPSRCRATSRKSSRPRWWTPPCAWTPPRCPAGPVWTWATMGTRCCA